VPSVRRRKFLLAILPGRIIKGRRQRSSRQPYYPPRTYASRRFSERSIEARQFATLGFDTESTGRLGIKLPGYWQILSLLKSANARSGSKTDYAIDLPAIVCFVPQTSLHLLDVVGMCDRGPFFAGIVSRSEHRRTWSRDPRRQR